MDLAIQYRFIVLSRQNKTFIPFSPAYFFFKQFGRNYFFHHWLTPGKIVLKHFAEINYDFNHCTVALKISTVMFFILFPL